MRLETYEIDSIKNNFNNIFNEGRILLFGSRTDDALKGGDIDLYLEPLNTNNLYEKKINFLLQLDNDLGEQKIDVIISKDKNRLIEQEALKYGIEL